MQADSPLDECLCGSVLGFDRVVVKRPPNAPIVTDFVACLGCRAMYYAPLEPTRSQFAAPALQEGPDRSPRSPRAIGGPFGGYPTKQARDAAKLKQDAAEAAKDYVKPGRHTPPRYRK